MVSVIIPTYNRARFIAQTIDSVLAQTCRDFEIIVIDDGSTDDTAAVVGRFGNRVKYLRQKNSERSVARNHGLAVSSGEFVTFLDSDDYWEPHTLQEMLTRLRLAPEAALVSVGCRIVTAEGAATHNFEPGGGSTGVLPDAYRQLLRSNLIGSPSAVLLRRSALERHGAFEEDRRVIGVEDWELWTRLAYHAPLLCDARPLVNYRRHEGNSPLAGMRMRYAWLIDALLRKLPLKPWQYIETCATAASRLVDYAGEFFELQQPEGMRLCLADAQRIYKLIAAESFFDRLAQEINWQEFDRPNGFTTTLCTKEDLVKGQALRSTLRQLAADSHR